MDRNSSVHKTARSADSISEALAGGSIKCAFSRDSELPVPYISGCVAILDSEAGTDDSNCCSDRVEQIQQAQQPAKLVVKWASHKFK